MEENHHSFLIVEHDPLLYEDAEKMVEYIAQALKQVSRGATILLYSPALGQHLEKVTELVDRVFCIYGEQAKSRAKAEAKMPGTQANLEAYPYGRRFRLVSSYRLKVRERKDRSTGKLY